MLQTCSQGADLKVDRHFGEGRYSKDVSGCSTAPYEFFHIVRNEDAEISNSPSSTSIAIAREDKVLSGSNNNLPGPATVSATSDLSGLATADVTY